MKILKVSIVVSFILLCASLFSSLFLQRESQQLNRDAHRLSDLERYAKYIQDYSVKNGSLPASIDTQLRQIGTADDQCELNTSHCSSTVPNCLNMNEDFKIPAESLPADIQTGNTGRTMYAVSLVKPGVIRLVACSAEAESGMELTYSQL